MDKALLVVDGKEAKRLLTAFGAEKYESEFDCLRRDPMCFGGGTAASVRQRFFGTLLRCLTIYSGRVRFCCLSVSDGAK